MPLSEAIDSPKPVRKGEELDLQSLGSYLKKQVPHLDVSHLEVLQFPSGHSNLTYLLRAGERELVLRRSPIGAKIKTAHDMQREYIILSKLEKVYPKVPKPLVFCKDPSVIGAPFFLMERIKGIILRGQPGKQAFSAYQMRALSENFIDNLVEIHGVDYQAAGLDNMGRPEGYVQRQIVGWTERYGNARTDQIPDMDRTAAWLAEKMPADSGAAMIHNDYKYDNLVLDPQDITHIIGVLDWEMATVGDPLMDLGTTLGYWIDPSDPPEMQAMAFGLTTLPGNLTRLELAERYAQKSGRDLSNLLYYYVYALYKIAVIIQQIYARYKAGFTHDERFASLISGVHVLSAAAVRATEKGSIT